MSYDVAYTSIESWNWPSDSECLYASQEVQSDFSWSFAVVSFFSRGNSQATMQKQLLPERFLSSHGSLELLTFVRLLSAAWNAHVYSIQYTVYIHFWMQCLRKFLWFVSWLSWLSWQFRKPFKHKTHRSVLSRLSFTGASSVLCEALVAAVGLDKDRDPTSLGPGSSQARKNEDGKMCRFFDSLLTDWKMTWFSDFRMKEIPWTREKRQVFHIVRALLVDPDVLCAFRPLSLVPLDIKPRMGQLLRLWQAGVAVDLVNIGSGSCFQPCISDVTRLESFWILEGGLPKIGDMHPWHVQIERA